MNTAFMLIGTIASGILLNACAAPDHGSVTYSGFYRQAFEQSDFYTVDGKGPFWIDLAESSDELDPYFVPKAGRASHTTVLISFRGEVSETPEFAYSGQYLSQLTVKEIVSVSALSEEKYEEAVSQFRNAESSEDGEPE